MKKTYLWVGLLSLALLGCEKKEGDKALHFGTSSREGGERNSNEVQSLHFGTSPGDGAVEEPEESLHFGTSPGDG